jgi:hypothetical protein
MDMRMTIGMKMAVTSTDKVEMPTVRIVASVEVIEVRPDGTRLIEEVITDVGVPAGEDADLSMAAGLEQELSAVVGLVVRMEVDQRGNVLRSETTLPSGLTSEAEQALQGGMDALTGLAVPLPAEPVGRGAVWRVRQPLDADTGFHVVQSTRYRLARSDGDEVGLKVTGSQAARRQAVRAPDLPAGSRMTLKRHAATFEGSNVLDLRRLVPTSDMRMRSHTEFVARQGREVISFSMDLGVQATVEPVPGDTAVSPTGSPVLAGQPVRSDRGYELTFPVGWSAEETSPGTHAWLYPDVDGEALSVEPVLWAFRTGSDESCVLSDFTRLPEEPPAWHTIDDAVVAEMDWLTGESGWSDAESSILTLDAGRTGRLGAVDEVGWVTSEYLYTDGEAWFRLDCWSPDPPDDRWLPIAETFAFTTTPRVARSS